MRAPAEIIKVFTGRVLNMGQLNSINEGFPIGEAWRRLILRFIFTETHGTGAGPIADAVFNAIKFVSLKNSRGWTLYNNVPGRALKILDQAQLLTLPVFTTFVAASGAYGCQINLWFSDELLIRPDDSIFDTSVTNKIQLDIVMGTIADFLTAPGTDTVTCTLDVYLERIRGRYPDKVKPREFQEIFCPAPANPVSVTEINLERAENRYYKRIIVNPCDSAVIGTPFSGTPSDTTLANVGLDSDKGELINKMPWGFLVADFKHYFQQETLQPGWAVFDFCRDKSRLSALASGVFSRLRVFWDNGTLSTSQVSAIAMALKPVY